MCEAGSYLIVVHHGEGVLVSGYDVVTVLTLICKEERHDATLQLGHGKFFEMHGLTISWREKETRYVRGIEKGRKARSEGRDSEQVSDGLRSRR